MPLLLLSNPSSNVSGQIAGAGAFSENQIIDIIYALYETDDTGWEVGSPEYITARIYCNAAIQDWASREVWRDLFSSLTTATDGTKTLTEGTWSYLCPTNFSILTSWVRTVSNGQVTFWEVKPPEMVAKLASSHGNYCYITGSARTGFYLNFNPNVTLTTGATINYEYYCAATQYSGATTTAEIPDPYYCVYYALARLLKNDNMDFSYEESKAREIMSNMQTNNIQGLWDIQNPIEEPLNLGAGFGN